MAAAIMAATAQGRMSIHAHHSARQRCSPGPQQSALRRRWCEPACRGEVLPFPPTTTAYKRLQSSSPFSFVRIPIPAPCRLHPVLPTGWVHFREAFQRTRPFTIPHQGGELFHVGEGLANGVEASVEAGALDLRLCCPLEAALVVVALELELFDEHQDSKSTLYWTCGGDGTRV